MIRSNGESLRAGAVLGRYRIIERIGGGGMGEVYRARDADLDRDVALKVLPSDLTGSEERVRRFVQEAKASSSLNHPHIVVVHEIGSADVDGAKHHFIAMELIEGETFRERIYKPHRDLKALLGHAAQAADALAKAHAAGIVHRDLKPDNLMVTRDGFAKVLDFGLAKLTEAAPPSGVDATRTEVRPDTRDGMVLGTIGYMSPEQAEGKPVDARSDIFSFGCILYEIVAKERPFRGQSQVDVLHAIVHDEPKPVTDINPNVPTELRRIIRRCLAKDPDQRFQSMKDLANTLRDLVEEYDQLTPGSGSSSRIEPIAAKQPTWPWVAGAAIIVLISLVFLFSKLAGQKKAASPSASRMKIAQVTASGQAYEAAISSDGRYIAYALTDRSDSGIRVRQVATNSEIVVRPQTAEVTYSGLAFSRDGDHLYALQRPRGSNYSQLVSIPTLGGEPRELVHDVDTRPSFSPDGKLMAFVRYHTAARTSRLMIADASGTNVRMVASRVMPEEIVSVSWSPDGKWLAVGTSTTVGGLQSRLELLSPEGKNARTLTTERWFNIGYFDWLPDMSGIVATAQKSETRGNQLWHISFPDGRGTPISSDLTSYGGVSVSADGKAIVSIQRQERPRIWKVDPATGDAVPMTDERAMRTPWFFDVAPDGTILYQATDGGSMDVWAMTLEGTLGGTAQGTSMRRLTDDAMAEFSPETSRASGTIYYIREDEQGAALWSMDRGGGARRQIGALPPSNADIDVSPDGRWVIYPVSTGLLRISTADGSRRALTSLGTSASAVWSPDGTKIAFAVRDSDRRRIAVIDAESGALLQELPRAAEMNVARVRWTSDGTGLLVEHQRDGVSNVWMLPIAGGAPRQITHFTDRGVIIGAIEPTPDGKSLYVGRASLSSDVVLITDFR